MWLIHQHNTSSNNIDYYSLYATKEEAIKAFKKLLKINKDFIDIDYLKEMFELYDFDSFKKFKRYILDVKDEMTILLLDDDYLVISKVVDGEARRP